jgi:hypothetical protein
MASILVPMPTCCSRRRLLNLVAVLDYHNHRSVMGGGSLCAGWMSIYFVQINVADINVIGETDATVFTFINQGATDALMFLSNLGDNTLNFHFQELVNGVWTDISNVTGPDPNFDNQVLTGTLTAGQTLSIHIVNSSAQIRLNSNASGGSSMWFQISRWALRGNGGPLPILNF